MKPHSFHGASSTNEIRSLFASTILELVKDLGFDGVDIDWETIYAGTAGDTEAANSVLLLEALRSALEDYTAKHNPSHKIFISVASPAGPSKYNELPLAEMNKYVDMWNLMAYK